MGASASASQTHSNAIDKAIRAYELAEKKVMKILLLGAGESGKSTVLKQMRIIHDNGFSKTEFAVQRSVIRGNLVHSIDTLVRAMDDLNLRFSSSDREADAQLISETYADDVHFDDLSEDQVLAIRNLWTDPGIQLCAQRASELQLIDSAIYFLNSLERICARDYFPTVDDVLRARTKTTGIVQISFQIDQTRFRVFDVGGQRSERRKWIHCFDNVNAVLFITAVSEYDQMLRENAKVNGMHDSLQLFRSVCNSAHFLEAFFILFLNKVDLLKQKIKVKPLTEAFPEYPGAQTYDAAIQFIEESFVKQSKNKGKTIFVHPTCGTDTTQIQFVLESVTEMMIASAQKQAGLY